MQRSQTASKKPDLFVGLCRNADGSETPAGFAVAPSEPTMASQADWLPNSNNK